MDKSDREYGSKESQGKSMRDSEKKTQHDEKEDTSTYIIFKL